VVDQGVTLLVTRVGLPYRPRHLVRGGVAPAVPAVLPDHPWGGPCGVGSGGTLPAG
jgi:hypothetical protein